MENEWENPEYRSYWGLDGDYMGDYFNSDDDYIKEGED